MSVCPKNQIAEQFQSSRKTLNSIRIWESTFENVNSIVFEWFCIARSKNFPILGPILQAKSIEIAKKLEITNFKASNGWLRSFKLRYNISFKKLLGESRDFPKETKEDLWYAPKGTHS